MTDPASIRRFVLATGLTLAAASASAAVTEAPLQGSALWLPCTQGVALGYPEAALSGLGLDCHTSDPILAGHSGPVGARHSLPLSSASRLSSWPAGHHILRWAAQLPSAGDASPCAPERRWLRPAGVEEGGGGMEVASWYQRRTFEFESDAGTGCRSISLRPTSTSEPAGRESISPAGAWRFRLDPENKGLREQWEQQTLEDAVRLPGSTDENRKGFRNVSKPNYDYLSRIWEYKGAAWYQRDFVVPEAWRGKRVTLFLERCHWETRVWLDGKPCGMRDSLCVPHVHELGVGLKPGRHTLTLRVDNSLKYDMGWAAHSTSEQTQTNWNGVVGKIELRATDPVWIEALQVYPDPDSHTVLLKVEARNDTQAAAAGRVAFSIRGPNLAVTAASSAFTIAPGSRDTVERTVELPSEAVRWDEFSPVTYKVQAQLEAGSNARTFGDSAVAPFGLRKLSVRNKRITLNGRNVFLRGTLECCIFPLTGYPPTDVESWLRILRIAKSYGLNHMRFHSWCPPEAAFEAADREGFLFHIEAPQWVSDAGRNPPRDAFIEDEVERILDAYGNHPSFGMLCMGNELQGDPEFLQKLVRFGQGHDSRHLYTPSTAWSQGAADDYRVVVVRGLHGPTTDVDFAKEIAAQPVPTISHEVGQWCVFPNMAEIPKYTGVTRPRNFGLIESDLAKKGLLDQAPLFTLASGKLSALLYKEEMEVLLRTPGHSGFQLLDLHDFPGQGTALVGILDPFWDSKGLEDPAEHRRYCGPVVPLLRLPKRAYTTAETLTAVADLAQFGPADIADRPRWRVTGPGGARWESGDWPRAAYKAGDLYRIGSLSFALSKIPAPCKLNLAVSVAGYSNSWDIWVYPAAPKPATPGDVLVARSTDEALQELKAGKKVLLFADRSSLVKSLPGSFTPVFWSPVWFAGQGAATMGILCDPKHPALAGFPTAFHTDWQWYDLLQRSRTMLLDGTPQRFRPIVQVIDNFTRNQKLGCLLEARVGDGRLIVCSMNLWDDLERRPAAGQMLRSIFAYMGSPKFEPKGELTEAELRSFLKQSTPSVMVKLGAKVVYVDSEDTANGNVARNAADGDPDTFWHTQWQPDEPPCPHEIQIDLQKHVELKGLRYLPRQDMENARIGRFEVYLSDDGKTWGKPVATGAFTHGNDWQVVPFEGAGRFLRLVALSGLDGQNFVAAAELEVILK